MPNTATPPPAGTAPTPLPAFRLGGGTRLRRLLAEGRHAVRRILHRR